MSTVHRVIPRHSPKTQERDHERTRSGWLAPSTEHGTPPQPHLAGHQLSFGEGCRKLALRVTERLTQRDPTPAHCTHAAAPVPTACLELTPVGRTTPVTGYGQFSLAKCSLLKVGVNWTEKAYRQHAIDPSLHRTMEP